jgi:hypothetical protein
MRSCAFARKPQVLVLPTARSSRPRAPRLARDERECSRRPLDTSEAAALPPGDELWVGFDDLRELVDEAALPDPWHADEGEKLRGPRQAYAVKSVAQDVELLLPADELCARLVSDVHAETRAHLERLPDVNRPQLALGVDCSGFCVVD